MLYATRSLRVDIEEKFKSNCHLIPPSGPRRDGPSMVGIECGVIIIGGGGGGSPASCRVPAARPSTNGRLATTHDICMRAPQTTAG